MKKLFAKINIQGVEYKLFASDERKSDVNLREMDGYCDYGTKQIVIDDAIIGNAYKKHVLIHEIVHAYLHESGLRGQGNSDWAINEQVVDWIAAMADKITKTSFIVLKEYDNLVKEKASNERCSRQKTETTK